MHAIIHIQSSAIITRSDIVRYCINNCRYWSTISIRRWIHKIHPYLALTGELCAVFCEYLWEDWPRYNGTALYMEYARHMAARKCLIHLSFSYLSVDCCSAICENACTLQIWFDWRCILSLGNFIASYARMRPLQIVFPQAHSAK